MDLIVAKSVTWSYLKRAWDNHLKFKHASRSLAKTGFFGGSKSVAGAVFSLLLRKNSILDVFKT